MDKTYTFPSTAQSLNELSPQCYIDLFQCFSEIAAESRLLNTDKTAEVESIHPPMYIMYNTVVFKVGLEKVLLTRLTLKIQGSKPL